MSKLAAWLLLTAVRAYQLALSPFLPPACRFTPNCSAYAREAIATHGACVGAWLTLKRLARCHPWGGEGIDLVPEKKKH